MGSIEPHLASDLRSGLGLQRAVETGTYHGDGARALARVFPQVVSLELSERFHRLALESLRGVPHVRLVQGDSRTELAPLAAEQVPTLYFLDGHWSAGLTAGEGNECPVLDEIAAIRTGGPNDCIVIDDARLFAAPPPPPHEPADWPTLLEVIDALRAAKPDHHVTVVHDQVIAVPKAGKPAVDRFGQHPPPRRGVRELLRTLGRRVRARRSLGRAAGPGT